MKWQIAFYNLLLFSEQKKQTKSGETYKKLTMENEHLNYKKKHMYTKDLYTACPILLATYFWQVQAQSRKNIPALFSRNV